MVSWLVAIPLFHIHALDLQEFSLRSDILLAHSLFSGDLPGEYTWASQHGTLDEQRTVANHYLRYSEIDFVILEEENDNTKREIQLQPRSLYLLEPQISLLPESVGELTFEAVAFPLLLYLSSVPSRAPPATS